MSVNAMEYIKNVGKSFGYAAADYFKEKNPAVGTAIKNSVALTKEVNNVIKDTRSKVKGNNIKEIKYLAEPISMGKELIGNIFSDIKTGKFYNKGREDEIDNLMNASLMGGDDDFDFDFDFDDDDDDFGIDDDNSGNDTAAITSTIDVVGSKVSQAVSMATAKSAQYIAASGSKDMSALLNQNNRLFGQVNTGLAAINSNMSALVALGRDVSTHIQNSGVFFTKSTELQTRQVELLEKLVTNTSPIENTPQKGYRNSNKRITDLLGSDDILDIGEYVKAIKDNISEQLSFITGMNDMFKDENGEGISMFKSIASNPGKFILPGVIETLIPEVLNKTMESFNESLSGFFGSLLMKINKASSNNDILNSILGFLNINNRLKTDLDPSLYKKDKVDFDGITRKSIIEVIPTYLSKILSSLDGKEETRYDYDKGEFVKMSKIKEERDYIIKSKGNSAGWDIKDEFEEKFKDVPNQKELLKSLEDFFAKSIEKGEIFNYRDKNISDDKLKDFGLTPKAGRMLIDLLKDLEDNDKGHIVTNFNKEIAVARDRITEIFERMEETGESVITNLYNGSIDEKNKIASPFNLNNIFDEYHNNVFYYLRGIYQYTQHVSDNVKYLGSGGGGNVKSSGAGKLSSKRAFTRVKDIVNNTPASEKSKDVEEVIYTNLEYDKLIRDIDSKYMTKKEILSYEKYAKMSSNERDKYITELLKAKKKTEESKTKSKKFKEDVNDFIGKITGGIYKLLNKPAELASDVLKKANKVMLDIIYGKDKEKDKGFLGTILDETKKLFTRFGKWADENIFKKFQTSIKDIIDKLFGEKGEDGKRRNGWFGKVGEGISENFKNAGDWVKGSFKDVAGSVKDFFTGKNKNNAYSGGNVTKTGLVAVSEGEMIIPSEYNPFFKGKTDKEQQRIDETNIVDRFFGSYRKGTKYVKAKAKKVAKKVANKLSGEDKKKKSKESFADKAVNKAKETASAAKDKLMGTEKDPGIVREMGKTVKSGINKVFDGLFGSEDEQKKKDQEKLKETVNAVNKEIGVPDNISAIITGGIIGGGISLLTGGLVSPLLGAAAGGAAGLVLKSKKVQKALFGDDEKDGLLPKKIGDFIKNKLPNIAKFATVGGIAGLVGPIPGGPVGGIILGSALSYAVQSEELRDWLLGNEEKGKKGKISKELQDKIKKAVPNMAVGATAGLIAGPFGIAGNLIFGAALGYATSTQSFQEKLFGKDGKSGLVKEIRERILQPLQETMQTVAQEIKFQIMNLFKMVGNTLNNVFKDTIIIPFERFFKSTVLKPLGAIAKVALTPVAGIAYGGFKAVTGMGKKLRENQIRKGRANDMMAKDRVKYRKKHNMSLAGDKTYAFDNIVKDMDDESVSQFKEYLHAIQNPGKKIQKDADEKLRGLTASLSDVDDLSLAKIHSISSSIRDKDTNKALKKFDKAMAKSKLSPEKIAKLRAQIASGSQEYMDIKDQLGDVNTYTQKQIKELKKKYGVDINAKKAWRYEKLLEGELKGRDKLEKAKTPEMKQSDDHHKELIAKMKEIVDELKILTGRKTAKEVAAEQSTGIVATSNTVKGITVPNVNTPFTSSDNQPVEANPNVVDDGISAVTDGTTQALSKDKPSNKVTQFFSNVFSKGPLAKLFKKDEEDENVKWISTATGELVRHVKNGQGEWVPDNTDKESNAIMDKQKEVQDAQITTAKSLSGLGGTLGGLLSKLFGKKEDDKPNLLDKLKEKFMDGFNKLSEFITGGSLSNAIGLGASSIVGVIGAGLVIKAFLGSEKIQEFVDNIAHAITGGGNDPKNSKGGYYYDKRTDTIDIKGKTYKIKLDKNGNPIKDGDGNYIDAKGNVINGSAGQWISEEKTGRTLQSRLIEDTTRGAVFKRPTVASVTAKMIKNNKAVKAITNSKVGKSIASKFGMKASTEASKEAAEKYVQNAAKEKASSIANNAAKKISKNATKAATKVNILEKMAGHTKEGSKLNTFLKKSADKVVAKNATSAEKITTKAASKVAKNATKSVAKQAASGKAVETVINSKMYNSLMGMISRALEKIPTIMSKIPFLKKFASSGDEIVTILYKNLDDAVKASAGKIGSLISSMSSALVFLKIAFIVADFYTGYQDARTTMGIVEKPTESQRLISGLIRVIKNLIPVIGALIPDKALVDLFVNKIAPIMGIDMKDLKRQREEAKNEVETYNKKHNTDYTIEDYNKKVLKDYTTSEKIGNFVKSVKKNIKEKGVVGAIKSGTQEFVQDKVNVFKKNFEKGGPVQAIAETVGSILPGFIGDGAKGTIYMGEMALKGKVKELLKYNPVEKDANMLTKLLSQITVLIPKIGLLPVSLVTGGIRKVLEVLNLDNLDSLKEIGKDIASIYKNAFTGNIMDMYKVSGDAEGDSKFASIFKNVALAIPKVVLTPISLVTTGVRKLLEALNLDNLDSLKEIGKDIASIYKNAFTGKLGDMYKVSSNAEGDSKFASIFKNVALAIPKVVLTPISLVTTGIRKLLEVLGIDSFGDVLDMGKDVIDMGKYAFTGQIEKLSSVGSDNGDDEKGGIAKWFKKFATFIPKIGFMPVALITTGIRKVLEVLGIDSFGDALDLGKDILSIYKNAFTGKLGDMYAIDRSGENDNAFIKFTKNLALAIPKITMTPVALITTGIRKVLEILNLDSFADILDLGKDIGSIYKNAFTGKLGDMYSIGSHNKEDSPFASAVKNIGLTVSKVALTPVALITTGIRKVLEILGIESFGDALDLGKDILSIGKYGFTGRIKEMYAIDRNGSNDNMFLKFTKNLALAIPKLGMTPIALVTTGIRKVLEILGIESFGDALDLGKDILSIGKYAFTGRIKEMYALDRSGASDNMFLKFTKNLALAIPKISMTPVALVTTGIRKVLEILNLDSFADILNLGEDLLDIGKYAFTGRIGAMYKVGSSNEDDSTLARIVKNIGLAIPKVALTPVAAITSGVRFVAEKIAQGIGFLRKATDVDNVIKQVTAVKSLGDLWKIKNTVDDDNPYKAFNTVVLGIGKVLFTPIVLVKGLIKGIGKFMDSMFEGLKMVKKGVEDFIDDPVGFVKKGASLTEEFFGYAIDDAKEAGGYFINDIKKKIKGKGKGSNTNNGKSTTKDNNTMSAKGSRLRRYVGGNSKFISQYDPEYAGNKYGGSNVSQDGCGPAVAAMAVNNAYNGGNVISMKDSLAYARRKGYEQKDGTSSDYFGDMFNRYGLDSEYIDNGNGSKSKAIKDRLASGSSVVLLGRDANNTSKANSPFGPGNHYVLATGLDNKGNVIVNDPEMQRPTVYSNKILNSSNLAISTGTGSRVRSRINKINRFKVYTGGASSVERQIFNFLTDKMGLNSAAASGILANIYKESSFNPNTVGDNGTSYGICQWHNGRYTNLRNWCTKNGLNYKTLHGQLCYLNHELTTGYKSMLNKFRSVPDTAEGAYKVGYEWCYSYERPANRQAKSVERGNLAKNTYFPKYKGQKGKYDKNMAISGNADTSASSSSSGAQEEKQETGLSKLTSLFGGLLGSYYGNDNPIASLLGFGNSSNESESSTTSYEGVSEGGPGNAKQKQLVAMMKSKLGQLTYSMNGPRNPDRGSADCSSTVNWAYKKVYGKDIGNNTASILSNNNTKVVQIDRSAKTSSGTTTSKGPVESGLQPGDILLYSRPTSDYTAGRQYRVGHVEMYAGNGKRIGHGGPGPGPKLTDLSRDGKRFIMAKRLKDVGSGSGIYDSRNYINHKHEIGSIVSIGGASEVDNVQLLKNKAKTAVNAINTSTSNQTMIALIKSIITLLTTMANNSDKINTIAELLQNYFNAKNGNTANNKQKTTTTKKTTKSSSTSTELDAATRELVDYLNSLAV